MTIPNLKVMSLAAECQKLTLILTSDLDHVDANKWTDEQKEGTKYIISLLPGQL